MSRISQSARLLSNKSQFHLASVASYLAHCEKNELSSTSTVFAGTLYELHVRDELSRLMRFPPLQYYGGSYDNGRDLGGKWDITPHVIEETPTPVRVRGRMIKPIASRKSQTMDVLVQCKCFSSKIQAKEIRELSGIFNFNVRPRDKYSTLGIMCSPSMLTAQAMEQMDRSEFPLVYVQIPRLRQSDGFGVYDPKGYQRSPVRGVYLNPLLSALWEGTDLLHLSHKIAC